MPPTPAQPGPYDATWTSLRRHRTPPWLIDAKFGVYCHWGLGSITQQPGRGHLTHEQALEHFTADGFDPEAWAELFERAGAKFAGPVAWHGGPLLHWDSRIDPFNTVKRNPHRDILGELAPAIRARGLKFFASFHAIGDDGWVERATEAVDQYHPDVFWVDASFGGTKQAHHLKLVHQSHYLGGDAAPADPDAPNPGHHPADVLQQLSDHHQRAFLAHLFNDAQRRGQEVEFVYKSHDIPPGIGMRDLENGLLDQTAYDTWMTDLDMNLVPGWNVHGWFHREGLPLRSAASIIHRLMDVVSKNGVLLLNAPPLPDGGFSDEVRDTLETIGRWLGVNGEAVYGASPWSLFGEGPTEVSPNAAGSFHHNDHFGKLAFTPEDVRFTANGPSLYAACLGRPRDPFTIRALSAAFKIKPGRIAAVRLLGHDAPLTGWTHDERGLTLPLPPGHALDDAANVFKIDFT